MLIYTVFIVQAYQTSTELLSTWCRAVEFFSASGAALSQEAANGKINVQSVCALDIRYMSDYILNIPAFLLLLQLYIKRIRPNYFLIQYY
jgi:hypothetical protein